MEARQDLNLWIWISYGSLLIPLLIGLFKSATLWHEARALLLWIIIGAAFEGLSYFSAQWYGNNLPLMHLYVVLEMSFLSYFFYRDRMNAAAGTWIKIIVLLFFLFACFNVLFLQDLYAYTSNTRSVESILLCLFALSWFYKVYKEQQVVFLEREFMFWFVIGILIYFTGNILLWVYGEAVAQQSKQVFAEIWKIHALLNSLLHLFYALALWIPQRKS